MKSRKQNFSGEASFLRYDVTDTLGSGSYGDVVLAEKGGNKYAIKTVSFTTPMSVLWEISLYNLMSHPNVMSPFEYLHSEDYEEMAIVMPPSQKSLEDLYVSGGIDPYDIKLISWQLLSAMDYLHSNDIVHRDLKPANILLSDLYVKVIDFGLARFLGNEIKPMSLTIQTYTHRAPEVYEAISFYNDTGDTSRILALGPAMDMWSVGLMILELFRGRKMAPPDEKSYGKFLMEDNVQDNYNRYILQDNHIPIDAQQVLLGLLQVDPKKRLTAEQAMKMDWFSSQRYQPPEKIRYPVQRPFKKEGQAYKKIKKIIEPYLESSSRFSVTDVTSGETSSVSIETTRRPIPPCKFPQNIVDFVVSLAVEVSKNNPRLLISDKSSTYIRILLFIAAAQIDEQNSQQIYGCDLGDLVRSKGPEMVYEVFKALRFNIVYVPPDQES